MSSSNSEEHNKLFVYNFVCGGIAGCAAKTTIAPLDRAKINFQSQERRYNIRALIDFLQKSYSTDGFRSLWRGNSATIGRIFPYAAIQYSSHERYKALLGINTIDLSHLSKKEIRSRRFCAGSMAGLTSVSITYPLDFARARMAVTSRSKYYNLVDAIRTVAKEEGVLTLYRGFTPALLGTIPYSGSAFFTFETLKAWSLDKLREEAPEGVEITKLDPFTNLLCGAFAGSIGQTVSYPLDIARRRMQTGFVTGHPEYTSVLKTMRLVWQSEGLIHGLYKGLSLNWIKGPIASGISFTVFHQLQYLVEVLRCPPI